MDAVEKLALRSEVAAESHLATTLEAVYAGTVERFTDEQIDGLRETFKLGWMTGFRAALNDVSADLKGLVDDE